MRCGPSSSSFHRAALRYDGRDGDVGYGSTIGCGTGSPVTVGSSLSAGPAAAPLRAFPIIATTRASGSATAGDDPGVPHAGRGLPALLGRAYAGWPRLTAAAPSAAHRAFAAWEAAGTLCQLVTQNVDRLHQRAGSRAVIDLHGRLDVVVCLSCGDRTSRAAVQEAMAAANPAWRAEAVTAPDGDADIADAVIESFAAPRCERCGGLLKPDVVFFGENVPRDRYERACEALAGADALLVAGSSLMVYSGFRFVRSRTRPASRSRSSTAAARAATRWPSSRSKATWARG